mmetsp:Transcript_54043/g.171491  ORF Transcript_54043/g.171491 Transcript_54043/m.171491 type:complete len:264 (-) Transcript_54043:584-1375(-)
MQHQQHCHGIGAEGRRLQGARRQGGGCARVGLLPCAQDELAPRRGHPQRVQHPLEPDDYAGGEGERVLGGCLGGVRGVPVPRLQGHQPRHWIPLLPGPRRPPLFRLGNVGAPPGRRDHQRAQGQAGPQRPAEPREHMLHELRPAVPRPHPAADGVLPGGAPCVGDQPHQPPGHGRRARRGVRRADGEAVGARGHGGGAAPLQAQSRPLRAAVRGVQPAGLPGAPRLPPGRAPRGPQPGAEQAVHRGQGRRQPPGRRGGGRGVV